MNKKKRNDAALIHTNKQPAQQSAAAASASAPASRFSFGRLPWAYIATFVLFWIFCTFVYGDVFRRAAEANFISTDDTQMQFLTQQSWGRLYCYGRWLLTLFSFTALGAALLSLMLTLTTVWTDRLIGLPRRWQGCSALLPGLIIAWMLWRGTNLYYKSEPSLIVLIPLGVMLLTGLAALLKWCWQRRQTGMAVPPKSASIARPWGILMPVLTVAILSFAALHWNENEILTARMQNRMQQADWEGIIDDALSAKRPSRAVAAYYAIALVQTGQLLERQFDIPFDFPTARLEKHDGNEEYTIFLSDCNFYAGLVNIGYRCAMDYVVMNGPNLFNLKRMAVCAILNEEPELARKYLDIIGRVPFQKDFVAKYAPMVNNRQLVEQDDELKCVLGLAPMEHRYEQNYRSPAFLGYNAGLLRGTNASLETAIAANLYSKDLERCATHIQIYAQNHNGQLPTYVQQAVTIAANKNPALAQQFQSIISGQQSTLMAFITAAKPIIDERMRLSEGQSEAVQDSLRNAYNAKLREALRDDWVGTYYYYYYCENNDKEQVRSTTQSGVN